MLLRATAGAGAIGALGVLNPHGVMAAENSDDGLVGPWRLVVLERPGVTIQVVIVFAPGGGLVEMDDGGAEPPHSGIGAWSSRENGRFRFQFFVFAQDPRAGKVYVTITATGKLGNDGNTLSGTSTVHVVDGHGNVLFDTPPGAPQTFTGNRIHA
jgi:hypothetical protein